MTRTRYSYSASLKSNESDEPINTYIIRPLAGLIVWPLTYTSITPNQVTIASLCAGFFAAYLYAQGTNGAITAAGLFVTLKDVLDSADGQLARATQRYSRLGRFLDSLGDVAVNASLFAAIGFTLFHTTGSIALLLLSALAFLSTTMRVSYHVFYHTAFLHLQDTYTINRLVEDIREEDLQDKKTLHLQRFFLVVYGWQDRLIARLDVWCRGGGELGDQRANMWFGDRTALRLSGCMGMGTELGMLTLFSLLHRLEEYLVVNVVGGNLLAVGAVLYRRFALRRRLTRMERSPS
ncbi:MAG: hypothetical protein C4326_11920 [Ignavibacteria bacterium]